VIVQQRPLVTVDNPLALVGNTPLIPLRRISADLAPGVMIYGKAEWFNPGGSVKDRPALNMILAGESSGALVPGKTILDATSGNTGIAYAWIGAVKGYPVKLALPANASIERKRILTAYGVELVLTDPAQGSDGAILKAREIYLQDPDRYFYPDQYSNPANWQAHYNTTAVEGLDGGGLPVGVVGAQLAVGLVGPGGADAQIAGFEDDKVEVEGGQGFEDFAPSGGEHGAAHDAEGDIGTELGCQFGQFGEGQAQVPKVV